MSRAIHVHFLPGLVTPQQLAGSAVVVIDVLRASTTIAQALASGAEEIIPCVEVDEARRVAADYPTGRVLLGGERGGLAIDGFDVGNSPGEYTPAVVAGKVVVFTTTNGTRAIARCTAAGSVFLGAFVNRGAVCARLVNAAAIHLVCAGTRGQVSGEDVLAAGAMVERLMDQAHADPTDASRISQAAWRTVIGHARQQGTALDEQLAQEFRLTRSGQNLLANGLDHDLLAASRIDVLDVVPALDTAAWTIRKA